MAVHKQARETTSPRAFQAEARVTASTCSDREFVNNESKKYNDHTPSSFGWTKPALHLGVQSTSHCRTRSSSSSSGQPRILFSHWLCASLYLGQLVLSCRHLSGRGLPALELRVLCSTKTRARRPTVPSTPRPQQSVQKQLPRAHSGPGWSGRMSNLESRHFWQTNTSGTLDFRIFAQDR